MLRRKTLAAGALAAGCLLAAQGAAAAPPGDVSAQLHGGTLTVRGGDDVDLVGIRARGLAIDVTAGDDASAGRFPLWAVRRIRVETGAGDDRVTLDDGPLALLRFTPVTIDGGDGYDVAETSGSPGGQDVDVDAYGGDAVLDRHRHDAGIRLRATEQLTAATGAGHDAVHVGQVGELLLQLDLDLGADGRTDRVTVDGTDGPDQFDAFGSDQRPGLRADLRAAPRRRPRRPADARRRGGRRRAEHEPHRHPGRDHAARRPGRRHVPGRRRRRPARRRRRRRLRARAPRRGRASTWVRATTSSAGTPATAATRSAPAAARSTRS